MQTFWYRAAVVLSALSSSRNAPYNNRGPEGLRPNNTSWCHSPFTAVPPYLYIATCNDQKERRRFRTSGWFPHSTAESVDVTQSKPPFSTAWTAASRNGHAEP